MACPHGSRNPGVHRSSWFGGPRAPRAELLPNLITIGAVRITYIGLVAAPYGVMRLIEAHPDVDIHVATLDRELDERGYICPGLGDAGDRVFFTGE